MVDINACSHHNFQISDVSIKSQAHALICFFFPWVAVIYTLFKTRWLSLAQKSHSLINPKRYSDWELLTCCSGSSAARRWNSSRISGNVHPHRRSPLSNTAHHHPRALTPFYGTWTACFWRTYMRVPLLRLRAPDARAPTVPKLRAHTEDRLRWSALQWSGAFWQAEGKFISHCDSLLLPLLRRLLFINHHHPHLQSPVLLK